MPKLFTAILFLSTFFWRASAQSNLVRFDDPRIVYSGRTGFKADAAELYWSGA